MDGGSLRLAAEMLADGATPCRLPHNELCTPPTADTVAEPCDQHMLSSMNCMQIHAM